MKPNSELEKILPKWKEGDGQTPWCFAGQTDRPSVRLDMRLVGPSDRRDKWTRTHHRKNL